ncbi:DUF6314 family protein [Streptomyces sp. AA1529]|uniref:DUF6314 family protein n=1 Tax=Streptomyces sp. AA1529 TaxID=1203257 RepID=UPI0002DE5DB2|nr:DUF6314 family protein [Streptomyces sp. AA1529]
MPPAPHPVAETLSYLAGEWSVRREVLDRSSGRRGRFDGRAEFRAGTGDEWLHVEQGVFEWDGVRREAGRTLRLLPGPAGTAEVAFADGRFFHALDLRSGRWTAEHQCGADLYEADFTVVSPAEWRLRWLVHGPAKDQLLDSRYHRPAHG